MNRRFILSFFLVTVLVITLGGCFSFESLMYDATLGKAEARVNQKVADAVGLGALEDSMIATIMYAQVFYAGGYGYGYEDFREGEGVSWNITSAGSGSTDTVEVERALLKRNADGTVWWFLRYKAEGEEEFLAESLVDADFNMVKFRYYDSETDSIREWIPEKDADSTEAESVEDTSEDVGFYEGDFRNFITGTESVTVPAGKYSAEHVLIEDKYEPQAEGEKGYEVRYEWWLADKVPGDIVKYKWQNLTEKTSVTGEMVSHKTGYKTRLESF